MSPALNVAKRTTTLSYFELDQYDCAVPCVVPRTLIPLLSVKIPTRAGTTFANLSGILKQLKEERAQVERQLSGLDAAIRTFANVYNPQLDQRRAIMAQKIIEVVGTSKESFAKAAENAVAEAAKTVRGLKWARVANLEMELDGKKIAQYRATTKIYFDIEQ